MLESQFRLRYNMIVNLLRVEDLSVEDMLKRSFAELHAQRAMKGHGELLHAGERLLRRVTALAAAHAGEQHIPHPTMLTLFNAISTMPHHRAHCFPH